MKQRIHERAVGFARSRMHHHARGFVDHHDVLIFVEQFDGDCFGGGVQARPLEYLDFDSFPGATRWDDRAVSPETRTRPCSINSCTRERLKCGRCISGSGQGAHLRPPARHENSQCGLVLWAPCVPV